MRTKCDKNLAFFNIKIRNGFCHIRRERGIALKPAKTKKSPTKALRPLIALFGCENVAPASVYSLMNGPVDVEIAVFGPHADALRTGAIELIDQLPLRRRSSIRSGETSDLSQAKICVISNGVQPGGVENSESAVLRNVEIVKDQAETLLRAGFDGVMIVTTSPAEIMARVAMEASGLDAARVIGLGPQVAPLDAGEFPPATWCTAKCCDTAFVDSCQPDCPYFEEMLERYRQYGKRAHKGPRTMASCVMRVCEAILTDEKTVLPVAAMMKGEHGILGTFLTVPCVIGRAGIEKVLELPVPSDERRAMLDTARYLGRLYHDLGNRQKAKIKIASVR
jgi:L-lactate dehydrogenase